MLSHHIDIHSYSGACVCSNTWRYSSAEKREQERLEKPMYDVMRHASEVHRQVRAYMHKYIKPGILLIDMCETLENLTRTLVTENGLQVRLLRVVDAAGVMRCGRPVSDSLLGALSTTAQRISHPTKATRLCFSPAML